MSCIQAISCQLPVIPKDRYHARYVSCTHANFSRTQIKFSKLSLAVVPVPTKFRQHGPVCLFGGKGNSGNADEGSPWKALEKVMGKFKKELSIEEQLKQQIAKNEFYEDGGNTGGGGGGGGFGGGGDSESEDEGFSGIVGEVLQVMFATLGFVFLYIFIIESEDITRLTKDFFKFIFTGKKSIRLGRALDGLSVFFQQFSKKPELDDEYWLEKEIINTPTWYDGPNKYKRLIKSQFGSRADDLFDDVNDDDYDDDKSSRSEDEDNDKSSSSEDDDNDDDHR